MYRKQRAVLERVGTRNDQVERFRVVLAGLLASELRAARTALGKRLVVEAFRSWIEDFYPRHEERVFREMFDEVRAYGEKVAALALTEIDHDGPVDVGVFAEEYTAGFASRWSRSSIAQLRAILRDEAEPEDVIRDRLDRWEGNRAGLEAENEATRANGAFAKYAFLVGGATELVWRAIGDSCPTCTAMNGRTVEITGMFLGRGDSVVGKDGDGNDVELVTEHKIGHPPLHGMGGQGGICDCFVSAA